MELLEERDGAEFVSHGPCAACGSSDANSLYTDGSHWCFGCETYTHPDGFEARRPDVKKPSRPITPLLEGDYVDLRARQITEKTCRKFGYMVAQRGDEYVQVATYKDLQGRPVAQKVRTADKQFSVVGDKEQMGLFGMHIWSAGKKIVVCEGEIDTMTVSQIQNNKFATVGVPHGAQSAKKHLLKHIDYLNNFAEIILMFDQDEAGQAAAIACAEVLPTGKVKIAVLPHKDPNECLLAGEAATVVDAIFQASEYRPDGIVSMTDLRESVGVQDAESPMKYPYPKLNEMLKGIRQGLITIAAGSGVGKSTLVREFAYSLQQSGFSVGMLMLEESVKRTAQGLVGIHMNKNITIDLEATTPEEITENFDDLMKSGPFYLFDSKGNVDLDLICNRIRYMKHGLGCDVVILDHVSILISSYAGTSDGNERVLIDGIMHTLRVLCTELDLALILVSHLRRPSGDKGHEGGERVSLSQLRGSHSIAQLADGCIGLQVPAGDTTSGARELVVLKNRFCGLVGPADTLQYVHKTGRLTTVSDSIPF